MFTLLVSGKSNSQNRHIYNFHTSQNPDTNVRGISSLESGECVPHISNWNRVPCQLSEYHILPMGLFMTFFAHNKDLSEKTISQHPA